MDNKQAVQIGLVISVALSLIAGAIAVLAPTPLHLYAYIALVCGVFLLMCCIVASLKPEWFSREDACMSHKLGQRKRRLLGLLPPKEDVPVPPQQEKRKRGAAIHIGGTGSVRNMKISESKTVGPVDIVHNEGTIENMEVSKHIHVEDPDNK